MLDDLFKGKLVKLTAARDTDAEEMARWHGNSDYLRNVDTDLAIPQSVHTLREQDTSKGNGSRTIEFRIRTLSDDALIGFVALHSIEWNNQTGFLAIGIGNPEFRGKGFGTDALQLILHYAFHECNLNRVGLDVISYNLQAIKAYERVGFQMEGAMRCAVLRDGKAYDRMIMGILRDEWQSQKASVANK
ncbi:GNAT family N-acetyltransferase [Neobacillus jeddahensis]|uniref:GNAT family N-acetyltransferase n=1 Tax=Neobacillus jeddahensis TaxID=1461580 RepID=UPI000BDE8F94|nr:GNAT family protein [Neobacillus jeddahensis]